MDTPLRLRESRWFWIPGIFGALLFIALVLRWLPAAVSKAHEPFGIGQIVGGDLILAWKSFLRCVVAYVLTALALDWLPPIRWGTAFTVAAVALPGEILAELVTARILGPKAGVTVQLAATAIAYSATLLASIASIRQCSLTDSSKGRQAR